MNAIKHLFSFLTCFLFCLSSFAQDKTITGNVSASENNTPLVGVTITVKGANRTTLTDESLVIFLFLQDQDKHYNSPMLVMRTKKLR